MQDRNAYFRYPWGGWRIGQHLRHEHQKDEGWKLHISALTVSAQTKLAELAESYGVAQYKYWQEPKSFQWLLMPADDEWPEYSKQYGKTFVVYYSKNDDTERPIDWHQFVEEADAIVKNNGGAGMPVRGDRKIPGTASVFYRCDYNQFANYVSREGASIDARDGRVEMEERYIADPNKPDPFKNIIVGSAKDFTSDEFAMFDAVYFGGCTKVQELLTKHPYLAFLRDPGTQMTMTEIAYELETIERVLQADRQDIFFEYLELFRLMPIVKLGNAVLCRTETREQATNLYQKIKGHVFDNPVILKQSMSGYEGVLVSAAEFKEKLPGVFDRISSVDSERFIRSL